MAITAPTKNMYRGTYATSVPECTPVAALEKPVAEGRRRMAATAAGGAGRSREHASAAGRARIHDPARAARDVQGDGVEGSSMAIESIVAMLGGFVPVLLLVVLAIADVRGGALLDGMRKR